MSFTLLTLPDVFLSTSNVSERGPLALECLSNAEGHVTPTEVDSGVTLGLHLNSHAFRFIPGSHVRLVIMPSGERIYTFDVVVGEKDAEKADSARIAVPPPNEDAKHVAEDIQTFDQLLTQYAELSWSHGSPDTKATVPPPLPARNTRQGQPVQEGHANIKDSVELHKPVEDPSLRGRLVLVDDSNGDVVGELPQTLHLTEDPALPTIGTDGLVDETSPVVLELHPDMYDACTGVRPLGAEGEELTELREVFVRAVPSDEQDWILKGANLISQAISSSTSLLISGVTSASNYYISHSTPDSVSAPGTPASSSASPKPPSPSSSNSALSKAHVLSGHARAASAKTADVVEGVIRHVMGTTPRLPSVISSPVPDSPMPQGPPPPYAVYTPKPRPQSLKMSSDKLVAVEPAPPEDAKKPLRTIDRVLMSANLVITTVDDSARRVFEVGSDRLGAVVGHKYGSDAQLSTHLATHTARNVVLVYVDMRGFARRALLKKAGTEFLKARVGNRTRSRSPSPVPPQQA